MGSINPCQEHQGIPWIELAKATGILNKIKKNDEEGVNSSECYKLCNKEQLNTTQQFCLGVDLGRGVISVVGQADDVILASHSGLHNRTVRSGPKGLSNLFYFLYRGILGGFKPGFRALGCVVNYHFIVLISFLRKCL